MITVKRLKELLDQVPDDAECFAFREEDNLSAGISINGGYHNKSWWIECDEEPSLKEYTEGFK